MIQYYCELPNGDTRMTEPMETKKENPECLCSGAEDKHSCGYYNYENQCTRTKGMPTSKPTSAEASPEPEKTAEELMIEHVLPNGGLLKLGEGQRILSAMKAYADQEVAAEKERSGKLVAELRETIELLKNEIAYLRRSRNDPFE